MMLTFDEFTTACTNYIIQHKLTTTVTINKFTNDYPDCYDEYCYNYVNGHQQLSNVDKNRVNKVYIEQIPILGVKVETNIVKLKIWLDTTFTKSPKFGTYNLVHDYTNTF